MPEKMGKRKAPATNTGKNKKRRQLILRPKVVVENVDSEASTLVYENPADVEQVVVPEPDSSLPDVTIDDIQAEVPGSVHSDSDSLSSLGDEEGAYDEKGAMRDDMPIVTTRWKKHEVDALMDALNVNRDAVKYHFDGPGGGKDIKRQAWRDVVRYLNDTANTHRTIEQCRNKADDYTQRVKAKYNRLRFEVNRTGRGRIKEGLKIKYTEGKALDYLREEAVKGIPEIDPIEVGVPKKKKTCERNKALLWTADREEKPKYNEIKMERQGVPNNYRDKNKRRVARQQKEKNRIEHEKKMKAERKKERAEARLAKQFRREERREKRKARADNIARKERKKKRAEEKEAKRKRKEKIKSRKDGSDKKKKSNKKTRNKNKLGGSEKKTKAVK